MSKVECLNTTREAYESYRENVTFDYGDDTPQTEHLYSWWFVAPMAIILAIVSVASVVGNGLVVATIARHRGMRTRTNLLLANLAAADILVGALDMPFSMVALLKGKWVFGSGACQFNAFTTGIALMASIHTLMFISIHKYISMTRPFSRAMTPLRISLMAGAAWAWSCLYNMAPFIGMTVNVYKKGATQCGPIIPCTGPQKLHSFINTFMNFLVPVLVMSFCNLQISRAVGAHMGRMRQTSNMNYRNSVLQQKHITVTLVIVMVCFLTCWTPYIIYSCTLVFSKNKDIVPLIFNPIVYWCGYLNSACNPIIYAFRSPSFRQGYLEILCRSKGDTRVGSFYSGSSIKNFARNHSDRIHAPSLHSKAEKGTVAMGGGRFTKSQWDASSRQEITIRHKLLPNSDAASRVVLQRLARRSVAQGFLRINSTRSSPDLHNLQDKLNIHSKNPVMRRFDSDSCLAMALVPNGSFSDTKACSFETLPDDGEYSKDSNQDLVRVIITDADDNKLMVSDLDNNRAIKTSTPCLRTESAYVVAIEGDQSIRNSCVKVLVTEASANSLSNISNSEVVNNSKRSIYEDSMTNQTSYRPCSLSIANKKDNSLLSLQDMSNYHSHNGNNPTKSGSGNVCDSRQRNRRYTEAENVFIPAPVSEVKFHSDPGLAPKRLGSVERIKVRKSPKPKSSPLHTPLLRNLAPKWRLSVEALDNSKIPNSLSMAKTPGIRGSIMALFGKGQSNS